ncbi:hypothetical protein [Halococcus agarilyticus]|uniref:hypothetical protein n=1 Tax=Halococcus agarilyticus TaxID=1232219 RepID=UPI0006782EE7|nr:hypothetical protein [Halococcus agarilyticus]
MNRKPNRSPWPDGFSSRRPSCGYGRLAAPAIGNEVAMTVWVLGDQLTREVGPLAPTPTSACS